MHKGTMASDTMRSVAYTTAATSMLVCLHGIFTDHELFYVIVGGFDLFLPLYGFGMAIALLTMVALYKKWPQVEYASLFTSIWFYALICMFAAVVTSLHSPLVVVCFSLTMLNTILATYIKKGEIDGEEDIGGLPSG